MPAAKVAVTIDENLLREIDRWVASGDFPNRSRVVQEAIRAFQVARTRRTRLLDELVKLDPVEERALAEEVVVADEELPSEVTVDPKRDHIAVTDDIANGKPRIAGHRITVQNIVIWHERLGMSADEIATSYDLSLADVYAALAYYYDHREVIDRSVHADEAFVSDLRRTTPSKLEARLGA
jgi:uncharacterized protein (DUF433 family)